VSVPARRESGADTVAGFLAAAAVFAGAVGLVYYPGRIATGAMLVSLVAVGITGSGQRRLATAALVVSALCWLAGMTLAVVLERPLF
jgi:hypothetical protein